MSGPFLFVPRPNSPPNQDKPSCRGNLLAAKNFPGSQKLSEECYQPGRPDVKLTMRGYHLFRPVILNMTQDIRHRCVGGHEEF